MLNIAICDDTPEERELVCALARRYFEEKNCPFTIPCSLFWIPALLTIFIF